MPLLIGAMIAFVFEAAFALLGLATGLVEGRVAAIGLLAVGATVGFLLGGYASSRLADRSPLSQSAGGWALAWFLSIALGVSQGGALLAGAGLLGGSGSAVDRALARLEKAHIRLESDVKLKDKKIITELKVQGPGGKESSLARETRGALKQGEAQAESEARNQAGRLARPDEPVVKTGKAVARAAAAGFGAIVVTGLASLAGGALAVRRRSPSRATAA